MANTKNKKDAAAQEQVPQKAQQTPTFGAIIGELTWLLVSSKVHRHNFFLADLEWMIMPAIGSGQFRIYRNGQQPVGAVLWGFVSNEVQKKLEGGVSKLAVSDWKSGENLWIIDIISPFADPVKMIEDMKKTVFAGKTFKYLRFNEKGERQVITESA